MYLLLGYHCRGCRDAWSIICAHHPWSSDKTTVSVATGHNEYWPFYASIGNIHNNVRRAHGDGLVLVGFLSIPKGIYLPFSLL